MGIIKTRLKCSLKVPRCRRRRKPRKKYQKNGPKNLPMSHTHTGKNKTKKSLVILKQGKEGEGRRGGGVTEADYYYYYTIHRTKSNK